MHVAATNRHIFSAHPRGLLTHLLIHSRLHHLAKFATGVRGSRFSTNNARNVLLIAASGTVSTAVTVAFWDDIKHGYAAAQRSGRVAATLAICINE